MHSLVALGVSFAARKTHALVQQNGVSADFAKVFSGEAIPSNSEKVLDGRDLHQMWTQSIDRQLRQLGIDSQVPVEIEISASGKIQVVSDHRRAAEIEASLASDPETSSLAIQLAKIYPQPILAKWPVGRLTNPPDRPYTMEDVGGYANWLAD